MFTPQFTQLAIAPVTTNSPNLHQITWPGANIPVSKFQAITSVKCHVTVHQVHSFSCTSLTVLFTILTTSKNWPSLHVNKEIHHHNKGQAVQLHTHRALHIWKSNTLTDQFTSTAHRHSALVANSSTIHINYRYTI